jgi:hypothetical protein
MVGIDPKADQANLHEAITYSPHSAVGQLAADNFGVAMSPIGKAVNAVDRGIGNVAGEDVQSGVRWGAGTAMDLIGALPAAGLLSRAAQSGMKAAVRGGEAGRQAMKANMDTAAKAGTSLTLGQASGNRGILSMENSLRNLKGGQGIMQAKDAQQVQEIGARMEQMANRHTATASPTEAGQAVQSGIFDKGTGWMDTSKAAQSSMYQELDKLSPPLTRAGVGNTKATLAELNEAVPGANALSADQFTNANIKGIERAVKSDTEGTKSALQNPDIAVTLKQLLKPQKVTTKKKGPQDFTNDFDAVRRETIITKAVPYTDAEVDALVAGFIDGKLPMKAIKKLRTAVGEFMDDPNLAASVKENKYRPLYRALSADMEAGYKSASPQAYKAWKDADAFSTDRHAVVDLISKSVSKDVAENVFTGLVTGAKNGDTVLRTVLDRIPKQGKQLFADTVLKRLGRTGSGESVADAGAFSTAKFTDDWGKLSAEAKSTLYGAAGSEMRGFIKSVAKTIDKIDGAKAPTAVHGSGLLKETGRLALSIGTLGQGPRIGAKIATSNKLAQSAARKTDYSNIMLPGGKLGTLADFMASRQGN